MAYLVAIIIQQFLQATLPLCTGDEGEVDLLATVLHKCHVALLSLAESRFQHRTVSGVLRAGFSPRVQTFILQFQQGFMVYDDCFILPDQQPPDLCESLEGLLISQILSVRYYRPSSQLMRSNMEPCTKTDRF